MLILVVLPTPYLHIATNNGHYSISAV